MTRRCSHPMKPVSTISTVFAALMSIAVAVSAQTFSSVAVDRKGEVRATTVDGRRVKLSSHGRSAAVSEDQQTVAWLELRTIEYHSEPVQVAKFLRWSRGGVRRSIPAGRFGFRDFWFIERGAKIAASLGAMHFAGVNLLYDANSGREIERYPDASAEPAPAWVRREPD